MLKLGWHFATVFGELDHDLLMQPNVHRRGILHASSVVELRGKLFASGEAAVQFEKFHQVNDRLAPIEILRRSFGEVIHDRGDVDLGGR